MDNNPVNLTDIKGLLPEGDSKEGDKSKGGGPMAHSAPVNPNPDGSIDLDVISVTYKKPSWISKAAKTVGGWFSSIWKGFSSGVVNLLKKGDAFIEKFKGDSPAKPLGETPMKPLGNSKQEILAVIFQTLDAASINTSDPSVQKAADDAILSYQDADILELSAISALRKSLNQNSNTRKEFIKRHKHNEAILKGKKYYKGKFIGENLKKALDYENALIDAYNKANGMKLTDFQESNMETILGLNHGASSDIYGTSEPKLSEIRYMDQLPNGFSPVIILDLELSQMQINYLNSINKPIGSHRYEPLTKEEYQKLLEIK